MNGLDLERLEMVMIQSMYMYADKIYPPTDFPEITEELRGRIAEIAVRGYIAALAEASKAAKRLQSPVLGTPQDGQSDQQA